MQYIRCSLIYSATAYFCPIFKRVVCDNLYSVLDTMTRVWSDKPQFILYLFINWTRCSSPEYPSSVIHCINALLLVAYTLCCLVNLCAHIQNSTQLICDAHTILSALLTTFVMTAGLSQYLTVFGYILYVV